MLHYVEIFCMRHTFDMTGASWLMCHPVRIRESKISWILQMSLHLKWCNSETCCQAYLLHTKTGRVHLCTVRLGSTLYSRQAAAFVSAYRCVCWCLKRQSILLKSTHSCLTMRQTSNVLVNKNHTHIHPHPIHFHVICPCFSFQL